MGASDQLVMFEPTGPELLKISTRAYSLSVLHRATADRHDLIGMSASARANYHVADVLECQAFVAEMTLQFEQLAGLS